MRNPISAAADTAHNDRHRSRITGLLDSLFFLAVVSAAVYIVLTCILADTPAGAYGQPRSPHLSADWLAPAWLTVVLTLSVMAAGTSIRWPLVGVCVYLVVTHVFPAHWPYWIYTQWTWVRTIVAVVTFAGWYMWARRHEHRIRWDLPTKLLLAVVAWYGVTFVIAGIRYGDWSPPMQFHPRQLVDVFLLYLVVRHTSDRERAFAIFATTIVIVVFVRLVVFQTDWYRDADVAMLLTLSIPMVIFTAVWLDRWWGWLSGGGLAIGAIYALYVNQNRGSAVAVCLSLITWWSTARSRWWLLCGLLPFLMVAVVWFGTTDFGARFGDVFHWQETLKTNERIITWRAGLAMAGDYPLFGIGPGFFLTRVGEYEPRLEHHSAHNIVVDVLAESGFPGLLLYLTFFITSAILLWREATSGDSALARWALIMLTAFFGIGMFISWTMLWLGFLPTALARYRHT